MQRYTVYLSLETALHVSGGSFNHHQGLTQLYLQHLALFKPYCYLSLSWKLRNSASTILFTVSQSVSLSVIQS